MDWIDGQSIGQYVVEKLEIPRPNGQPYIPMDGDLNLVLHTTEGSTIAGEESTVQHGFDPPHVVIGNNRIVQHRPFNAQAAALHDPMNTRCIQVELVAKSQQTVWMPDDSTLLPLIAFLAWASLNLDIPLAIPYDWPDDCSDIKTIWSSNNTRRQQAQDAYPDPRGIWMHLEIPNQGPTWHWDCGALQRSVIIQQALQSYNGNP